MRTTKGMALISHAVIRGYGMTLESERDKFPMFYTSDDQESIAAIKLVSGVQDSKSTYLYEKCLDETGDQIYKRHPAMNLVRTWVHHPQENRIMSEIISLNFGLLCAKRPALVGSYGTDDRIEELDKWHDNFSKKYSEILTQD